MTLSDFIEKTQLSLGVLSKMTGITRPSLYAYMKGESIPPVDKAFLIQDATGGRVKARSFCPDYKPRKKRGASK